MVDPERRGSQLGWEGAPESLASFVVVSDHVLLNLDAGWGKQTHWWKMDNSHLTSIAYADDICFLASSRKDLELIAKECIVGWKATAQSRPEWKALKRSFQDS